MSEGLVGGGGDVTVGGFESWGLSGIFSMLTVYTVLSRGKGKITVCFMKPKIQACTLNKTRDLDSYCIF